MNDLDLYAEFENQDNESVEIDLDFADDYEDSVTQAREQMDMADGDDDPELVGVHAYATNGDLQALADKFDWDDLWSSDREEVVKDFLALDSHDQIKALHLYEHFATYEMREVISSLDSESVYTYRDEDEIIDEWLEMASKETMSRYIDKGRVLKDYYHNRERLDSGTVIVVQR